MKKQETGRKEPSLITRLWKVSQESCPPEKFVIEEAVEMLLLQERLLAREQKQHAEAQERVRRAVMALTNPLKGRR